MRPVLFPEKYLIQYPVKSQSTLTEVTFGVVPPTIGKLIQKIEEVS
jgi:hypothetical protein